MTDPAAFPSAQPAPSAARMYAAVMGVGIACAVAIVAVYEVTRPVIQRNTIALRQQAILEVLPNARTTGAFRFDAASGQLASTAAADESAQLFAGHDEQNRLVGVAIETQGMGYQGVIRVLYGYSFEQEAIVGMRVLKSRETPGLGDRVETDATFLKNFERLDVRLDSDADALLHKIEFVKPGHKQAAWQIDGISGATITSRAIAEMLRDSASVWLPRVNQQRATFDMTNSGSPPGRAIHDQ